MASVISDQEETLADVLARLGNVPPERVLMSRPWGSATEKDVLRIHDRTKRCIELIDGIMVEKASGYRESYLAGFILHCLRLFVDPRNLGMVLGADGMFRFKSTLIRMPDVAFISWDRVGGRLPNVAVPRIAPNLAIEVLSASNTKKEIARKCLDFFEAGVELVWIIDPRSRTARVLVEPGDGTTLDERGVLEGGPVLPGFELELAKLFAELDRAKN